MLLCDGYSFIISAMNLSLSTDPFDVAVVPLTVGVFSMTTDDIEQDSVFGITLELRDETTDEPLGDITWRVSINKRQNIDLQVFSSLCEHFPTILLYIMILRKFFDVQ